MLAYTSIVPVPGASLPAELGLFAAAVELDPPRGNPQPVPSYPREVPPAHDPMLEPERVGRVDGVVLDRDGHVEYFIVLLDLDGTHTLVPARATHVVTCEGAPIVRLPWTFTQLAAQPRLPDEHTLPAEFRHHPLLFWSGNTPVPPGGGFSRRFGAREAIVAGGISAAAGAVLGVMTGGLAIAGALAVFFGVGGAVAGGMTGGSREYAADAKWMYEASNERASRIAELERLLRDRSFYDNGVIRAVRIRERPINRQSSEVGSSVRGV